MDRGWLNPRITNILSGFGRPIEIYDANRREGEIVPFLEREV